MPAPQHRTRTINLFKATRFLALLASGAIVAQASCLGRLENSLDLLAAPSAIANATQLPFSPLLEAAEFLVRFWF